MRIRTIDNSNTSTSEQIYFGNLHGAAESKNRTARRHWRRENSRNPWPIGQYSHQDDFDGATANMSPAAKAQKAVR